MRGIGKHVPPWDTQNAPADNTTEHIEVQVTVWRETGQVIHVETAREIAAWYASPRDHGFTAFATSGTLLADDDGETLIGRELAADLATADPGDDADALRALAAYLAGVNE